MNYVYSEDGLDVKVIYPNGNTKFVPKKIAENPKRRASLGFEIFEAPIKLEPLKIPNNAIDPELINDNNVAEVTPAKRGRKPKQ